MSDTSTNVSKRPRKRPVARGIVKDIPVRQKAGEWNDDAEQWKQSPGEKFHYEWATPSSAPYLKGRFGVETACRNTRYVDNDDNLVKNEDAFVTDEAGNYVLNDKGNKIKRDDVRQVCDLYVIYDPATAQANIDAARAAAEKAKAKAAAKAKASGARK